MPPAVALLFCICFVWFLLKFDQKQRPKVSRALWIPTIWMLISASRPVSRWTASGNGTESVLDQMVLGSLFLAGFVVLVNRKPDWSSVIRNNIWVMLLLGYMLVSITWSEMPGIAFKRWIRELGALLMALLVLTDPEPRQAMQSILRRTVFILIPLSIILVKYFPQYGVDFGRWSGGLMWTGVTMQKNGLGRLCAIAAFFLIWTLIRRRQGRDNPVKKYQTHAELLVLIVTFWLLKGPTIQAYSATALVALSVGISVLAGLYWMKKHRRYSWYNATLVVAVLGIANGIATPIVKGHSSEPVANSEAGTTAALGRDASFTGRTEIWAGLLPDVERNPILGSGFSSFWTKSNVLAHNIGEAHNGYLDLCLELGVVGVALAVMFLLSSCRKAIRVLKSDFDWGCLLICSILMAVFHNTTESSINSFCAPLSALVVFLTVSFPAAVRSRPRFGNSAGAKTRQGSQNHAHSDLGFSSPISQTRYQRL